MSYTWFKLHHDLPDDIKLRRFTPQEKWAWVALLCLASKSSTRGVIVGEDEDLAEYCEFNTTQDWLYYRDKLIGKGMLEIDGNGNLAVLHWEDRQYEKPSDHPEAVKQRVARHRAKKKKAKQPDETPCNALQTPGNANETPQIRSDPDKTRQEEIRQEEIPPLSPQGVEDKRGDIETPPEGQVRKTYTTLDPTLAMFSPKPWRDEMGNLKPEFLEHVTKQMSGKSGMHPKAMASRHIVKLEREGDLGTLEIYWEACNAPVPSEPERPSIIDRMIAAANTPRVSRG